MPRALLRALPTCCGIALLALVAGNQYLFTQKTADFRTQHRKTLLNAGEPLLPRVEILRALSLGHPETLADLIWLQSIQYFGGGKPSGSYPSLPVSISRVTELDPEFAYPYEFGMIVLPYMDNKETGDTSYSEAAINLGLRSREHIPNEGWLRYHLASIYMINRKDYKNAAKYYQEAALIPGSPGAAKTLAGTALGRSSETAEDRLLAIQYWKDIKERNKDTQDVVDLAETWVLHLENVYIVEKASETYTQQTGRTAQSVQDLVDAKLIGENPRTGIRPNGLELVPETGRVKDGR